ncbi:MAG TPA: hypothetical protein VGG22_17035 [Candidatus Baltobacteraceae bacterium]|jgi:hypothetical protein
MLIAGAVTENEGHALMLAAEQARQLLVRAGAREWKIDCELTGSLHFEADRQPAICIVSLLREVDSDPLDQVRIRLMDQLGKLDARQTAVYLCTVFRACENDAPLLERIRRLNLLAADLSHHLDIGVIDFDRQFADFGARPLQTSYRLEGGTTREIAAYTILKTLLASGAFDNHVDDETIEKARAMYDRAHKANVVTS